MARSDKGWSKKEIFTVVVSVAAFALSAWNTYYTAIRVVDDARVAVERVPVAVYNEQSDGLKVGGRYTMAFINAGTRPLVILRVYVNFERRDGGPSRCVGPGLDLKIEPFVVKEKDIVTKEGMVEVVDRPYAFDGDSTVGVCLGVQLATPGRAFVEVSRDTGIAYGISKQPRGAVRFLERLPIILFRQRGTIFDD